MECPHLHYTGGINPFGGDEDCYNCDLCGKTWDWDDAHVKYVCKTSDGYHDCKIWKEYA